MRLTHAISAGASSPDRAHDPLAARAMAMLRATLDRQAQRRQYRRDARQLDRFSDRELWDLGLSRSDVKAIGKGTYRRD